MRAGRLAFAAGGVLLLSLTGAGTGVALTGDTDCDGTLSPTDVAALVTALFSSRTDCPTADVNRDGRVSAGDLPLEVSFLFAPSTSPTPTAATMATATA